MSEIEIKTDPVSNVLIAQHIPAPSTLLEMRARGLGVETIADEIGQSVRTTRVLLTNAQRSSIIQAARDILTRDLVPKIVDNISAGLDRDNVTKRDLEVAEYSLKLAERLGITDISVGPSDHGGEKVETLEEYIVRRRIKHESTHPSRSTDANDAIVVTATRVDVSHGEPSIHAAPDDSHGATCDPRKPGANEPASQ
jgi:hypothetical protein